MTNEFETLRAIDVNKTFGQRQVLFDVNLEVRQGEVVGLLGPNGAGKTTLFMIMCGLLSPNSGTVELGGVDVSKRPLYWRAQHGVGYLPQESSIFRSLSVEQNISAVLERAVPDRSKRKDRLEALIDEFKLTHIRKSKGGALSGGERRRTEVARCLATDPRFILLDEPFAGVDPIAVADVRGLILGLAKKDIGILITDHNVQGTLAAVDHATILADRRVLAQGTPEELLENNLVRDIYLGHDFKLA